MTDDIHSQEETQRPLEMEESKIQTQDVDAAVAPDEGLKVDNGFQGTQAESLLNFKVFHCSSQDSVHTVGELTSANLRDPNNLIGWHS